MAARGVTQSEIDARVVIDVNAVVDEWLAGHKVNFATHEVRVNSDTGVCRTVKK